MRSTRVYLNLVLGLTILLGVQLTGLPCLQDTATTLPGFVNHDTSSGVHQNQVETDACPCHLQFVSTNGDLPQLEAPASPLAPRIPPLYAALVAAPLFRPPATV